MILVGVPKSELFVCCTSGGSSQQARPGTELVSRRGGFLGHRLLAAWACRSAGESGALPKNAKGFETETQKGGTAGLQGPFEETLLLHILTED